MRVWRVRRARRQQAGQRAAYVRPRQAQKFNTGIALVCGRYPRGRPLRRIARERSAVADEWSLRIPIVRIANVQPTSAQLCICATLGGSSGGAPPLVATSRAVDVKPDRSRFRFGTARSAPHAVAPASQYGREEAGPRVLQVRGLASAVIRATLARAAYNRRTSHA